VSFDSEVRKRGHNDANFGIGTLETGCEHTPNRVYLTGAQKRKTPVPEKGPGSNCRMGEGLGGWGHATRHVQLTSKLPDRSVTLQKFFRALRTSPTRCCGTSAQFACASARTAFERQGHPLAVRIFQVSQVDKATAPFDDVAGADREPVGKSAASGTLSQTHGPFSFTQGAPQLLCRLTREAG
jgi:hypothetical protein